MSYLAVGTLGVTAITLTFHLVSARIIPPAINSYTVNPLIEEMITILPAILLARFTVLKEKLSILDWMLLGAALGCGFQIMETGIRIIGLSQKWPHFQVGWTDVGDILTTWLPERIEDRNIGYAGHGIAAAFMGLGVGFWTRYKRWGWTIFLATFLWCVLDHSLSNYTLGSWAGQKKLAKFFWGITLKGKSMPWVLGLAVVGISLHDIYQRSAFRSVAEKCGATIAETTNRIGKSVFWHHPISTLRKSFHDHFAEFRGKTGLGKAYEIVRIYFWLSIIVVFFLNGIFPKSFYQWYLKTPFWWSAGIIGHAFALWFAWKWFNKWHTGPVPRNIRSQIIFWGQGFISVVSPLLAAGSVAVVVLAIIGKPILLKTSYLYYAANAFLDFIRNGLSPVLGVLNGIGGFVSNAYAQQHENDRQRVITDADRRQINSLARTIYGETRGENNISKEAVAWTIRNRTGQNRWWGNTYEEVARFPNQYSCWDVNDPNYDDVNNPQGSAWVDSQEVATRVYFADRSEDPTHGATHYYDRSRDGNPPLWSRTDGAERVNVPGVENIRFFRGVR